jgi:hypothetical protein
MKRAREPVKEKANGSNRLAVNAPKLVSSHLLKADAVDDF